MTATTTILSLVIIVLCGSFIYMYFFGTAKIKPSDIVGLVDYKIKLNQLSNRIDMIDKKEQFECSPFGNYPSDKVLINRLEKENAVLNERIEALQKELDFVQDTGNRKKTHSVGFYPQYANIVKDEGTKEIKSCTLESISICGDGDVLTEEAKESIKKQFAEMFPIDKNFKIVDHKKSLDLSLEPSEESRKKFMELLDSSKKEEWDKFKLEDVVSTSKGIEFVIKKKPQAPEDRIVNQAKKPVPPKPRNN